MESMATMTGEGDYDKDVMIFDYEDHNRSWVIPFLLILLSAQRPAQVESVKLQQYFCMPFISANRSIY